MVRRRSSRKKKSSSGALGRLLVLLLILGAGSAAAAAWFLLLPAGPSTETFVEIAPGSSTTQIAAQLQQAGILRTRFSFDALRLWKHSRLKAGEYRFDHPIPATEVYARIARGDVFTLAVTVPEGATRFDVANRILQAGLLKDPDGKQSFLAATIHETPLIADLDPQATSLEGYLFPATYRFPRNASPNDIVSTMVHHFRTIASQLGLTQLGLKGNLHSIVTLASLVERETAVPAERPLVASVLSNRLDKNMPLMTDPAVIYGLQLQGKWRGTIYQSDLSDPKHDTPYNTYHHTGLPPGPIANPGIPSLRAAMSPAPTDYLYFVAAGADPQGKSRFAATLEQHNKNVASYRQAIQQAGGH